MLAILPGPEYPTIDAHHRIVKVYGSLTEERALDADINVDDSVDEANGVNKNVFFLREENTGNARNDCNKLKQRSLADL